MARVQQQAQARVIRINFKDGGVGYVSMDDGLSYNAAAWVGNGWVVLFTDDGDVSPGTWYRSFVLASMTAGAFDDIAVTFEVAVPEALWTPAVALAVLNPRLTAMGLPKLTQQALERIWTARGWVR